MTPRIRRLNAREVEALLRKYGFVKMSQRGSHRKWRHLERNIQVIVPDHGGQPLAFGTLRNICETAELPAEEWRDEFLLVPLEHTIQLPPLIRGRT